MLALAVACKPDIGSPPSLIYRPRILAARSTPAEAKPGTKVKLDTLIADPNGTQPVPVAWTICQTPKPPAESNAVSSACVQQPDDGAPVAGPFEITIPTGAMGACTLFGPMTPPTPPGGTPIRPRDPDATGGFYQPVRAAARGINGGDLLAFALVRVTCNLANAPPEVAQQFNMTYTANVAPTLSAVVVTPPGGAETDVLAANAASPALTVHPGDDVDLRAQWSVESEETFPVFDLTTRALVDQREVLAVSWYVSVGAGELDHDRTGRDEGDAGDDGGGATSTNTWRVPPDAPPATVHFWAVLTDSRGGTDFRAFDLAVAP